MSYHDGVVEGMEEISAYCWSNFCPNAIGASPSNYQLSHKRYISQKMTIFYNYVVVILSYSSLRMIYFLYISKHLIEEVLLF